MPTGSHAPGGGRTIVLAHGLFSAAGSLGASAAAGRGAGGELGSLEEVGAAFTEPSPAASSLGSSADEFEWADTALAAAEAQMGRRCLGESLEGDTALTGDLLEEENWEWLTALGAAIAPPLPRGRWEPGVGNRAGKGLLSLFKSRCRPRVTRRTRGRHRGRGQWPPRRERPPPKGPRQEEASSPQQPARPGRGRDPGGEGAAGRVDPANEGEGETI